MLLQPPDVCMLFFIPVIRGKRMGGRGKGRERDGGKGKAGEGKFLCIKKVIM